MDIANCLTPYKWKEPVLVGSGIKGAFDYHAVDCSFVFRHNDRFYMMYVGFDGIGYQTALATSDDLLNWEHLALILTRSEDESRWDARNVAGTWMLRDNNLHGSAELKKWQGKYWLVYHAYPGEGYETGSAKIGLAWTEDENLLEWHRLEDPILVPEDGEAWELGGLYKECLVEHEGQFYLFYNAKNQDHGRWIEQTGIAMSTDLINWTRHQQNPVLPVTEGAWDSGFASDPCVLQDGSRWVMFYFGFDFKKAQEGIAISDNLLDWEKYEQPIIEVGTGTELDASYAHKPSVITHNGILYHFYTACRKPQPGDATCNFFPEFRTIAVATSKPLVVSEMWTDGLKNPLGIDNATPRLSWSYLHDLPNDFTPHSYRINVASSEALLWENQVDMWDSGIVNSNEHTSIVYGGTLLQPGKRYYWRVSVYDAAGEQYNSYIAWWEMGLMRQENWQGKWIAHPEGKTNKGATLFEQQIDIKPNIKKARMYVCGLGHFELKLNGNKVGNNELEPGWTNYDQSVLYTVYDVTNDLNCGNNSISIEVGNGFYHVVGGRYTKFKDSFGTPTCRLNLVVDYVDGSTTTFYTDEQWVTSFSPTIFSCIYGGEDYNALLENNLTWIKVIVIDGPKGKLQAQSIPAIQVLKTFQPQQVNQLNDNTYIIDFGQNFSGWPKITVSGKQGAQVKLIPGELLTDEGLVNQKWTGSPCEFNYTLKGETVEIWNPKFTYSGFRYLQIEGATLCDTLFTQCQSHKSNAAVIVHQIQGEMLSTNVNRAGSFSCSDSLINRVHDIIHWAMVSNTKSVFTDCPHREKLGWLEQVHLMGPSLIYNFDMEAMFHKVMQDMQEAQLDNGMIPTTAPEYVVFQKPWDMFRHATPWGGSFILMAWEVLQRYGNSKLIETYYKDMQRYIDYLAKQAKNHIIQGGLGDWYDIGPEGPGFSQATPVSLVETAIYYHLTDIMQKIANLLALEEDRKLYEVQLQHIYEAFQAHFWNEELQTYAGGSDTALAMPLVLGLVAERHQSLLTSKLAEQMEKRGYQTTAGDVGHRYVLQALSRHGYNDLIVKMLQNSDSPGYGYQIKHGATTLTEAWDGPTVGKSQNHFMLGHIEEWFYNHLAGLDYHFNYETKQFQMVVEPYFADSLQWAAASQRLRAGDAAVRWEKNELGDIKLRVTVPANTICEVKLHKGQLKATKQWKIPATVTTISENAEVMTLTMDSGSFTMDAC
ncbi:family 78 glycoside hydrolase catalytic domain [Paenibacillus yanchengensis]|uniref:alpha-L-rhamnosidase n=1 Tax=Paenibacillus yanchengensis TaxID=2035833 RepID=A0ABW4YQZ1_9BACL